MSLTLQVLLGGIAAGAVYGVVAIGHTIIFRLTGVVHFAFGDLIGLGVFTCLAFAVGTAPATQAGIGGERFLLAVAAAGAVCFAVGVATYLFVIEPFLARGSVLGWVGGVVAVALAIEAFLNSEFARPSYVFPDPLPFRHVGTAGIVHLGGATFQVRSLFVIGFGVLLAVGATWTLRATPFGRALTAIAQDPEAANIVGLEVRSLTALAFGLVGALAAVLAVVAAPGAPFGTQSGALYG